MFGGIQLQTHRAERSNAELHRLFVTQITTDDDDDGNDGNDGNDD